MKKIVLVELNKYHTEVLYAQLLFLKQSDYYVVLVGNRQTDMTALSELAHQTRQYDFNTSGSFAKALFSLLLYLYKQKPDVLLLNTAQGPKALYLSLLYWSRKTKMVGVYHNVQKFQTSLAQRIIAKKFRSALVLSEYIKKHFPLNKNMRCESFMASFFPSSQGRSIKPKDEFWVCVPGAVEMKRRDYYALLNTASLDDRIRFILLGRSNTVEGWAFRKQVEALGLSKHFVLFEAYVPADVFENYVFSSDLIMPLIHPNLSGFNHYLKHKISGTMNIAYAFEKPMFYHAALDVLPEYANAGVSYSMETLFTQLNAFAQGKLDVPEIKNVDFVAMKERYISFLAS